MSNYECALTGREAPPGMEDESDGMGDMPVGWTRVTVTRRQYNAQWILLQQVKEAMVMGLLQQIPPEYHEAQRPAVEVQVAAQFHALEKDTPMYDADVEDVVYLSDAPEIIEDINELRQSLGLAVLDATGALPGGPSDAEDEDDEEDDES